jgi:predicted esterase
VVAIPYFDLLNQAIRLYRDGKLSEAYDLVTENSERVGGNPAQILNFRYSIASRLGDKELALSLMRKAIVDRGYWYGYEYLMEDNDLESLRGSPEFQSLAWICREREAEAKKNSKPSLRIVKSEGSGSKERKLLMALHGNGDNVALTENFWLPCLRLGYSLALPQSSQISFWEAYTWADLERGRSEVSQHLSLIRSALGAEPGSLVLAGFSGGANQVLLSVLKGDAVPRGLILVAPWLPELDQWAEEVQSIGNKGIRWWILCGDQDHDCLEGSKKLGSILRLAGVHAHLEIVEGLDHDFPVDFEERLLRIMKDFQV